MCIVKNDQTVVVNCKMNVNVTIGTYIIDNCSIIFKMLTLVPTQAHSIRKYPYLNVDAALVTGIHSDVTAQWLMISTC